MVYSRLLNEIVVVAGVNNQVIFENSAGSQFTFTLTEGRYRDIEALLDELEAQSGSFVGVGLQSFTAEINNSTGIVTFSSNGNIGIDFDTTNWGVSLRDELGWTTNSVAGFGGSTSITSNVQAPAGFYPSEPVEADSRPLETGTDTWTADTFQSVGRSGVVATTGGANLIYEREITIIMPSTDLEDFSTFLTYCAKGRSFAFYHDRDVAWPGSNSEYEQYYLAADGDGGVAYAPIPVDPANKVWHRQTLKLKKYVAATTN